MWRRAALLKLAILFPSQVLSLSLVGLSSLYALPRHIQAFQEVGNAWHSPEDEAIWAECVEAIGQFVLTEVEGREEAWDRFLPSVVGVRSPFIFLVVPTRAHVLNRPDTQLYNPCKARNVWMSTQPNQRVSKITPELLGEIEHPLLLIQVRTHLAPHKLRAPDRHDRTQGEADKCFPAEDVAAMAKHLTRSRDLRFHIEAGACSTDLRFRLLAWADLSGSQVALICSPLPTLAPSSPACATSSLLTLPSCLPSLLSTPDEPSSAPHGSPPTQRLPSEIPASPTRSPS